MHYFINTFFGLMAVGFCVLLVYMQKQNNNNMVIDEKISVFKVQDKPWIKTKKCVLFVMLTSSFNLVGYFLFELLVVGIGFGLKTYILMFLYFIIPIFVYMTFYIIYKLQVNNVITVNKDRIEIVNKTSNTSFDINEDVTVYFKDNIYIFKQENKLKKVSRNFMIFYENYPTLLYKLDELVTKYK